MKLFFILLSLLPFTFAAPQLIPNAAVVVTIPVATVIGTNNATASVESFYGVPYAQPPIGSLRLKPPQPLTKSLGTITAKSVPQACAAMPTPLSAIQHINTILDSTTAPAPSSSEDCLTINVHRPTGTTSTANLPVLFWIYGGGFQSGSTSAYDGQAIVSSSASLGKPIIFVAVNYRLGGFGFMPGKEVLADGSANLGLLDQRLGLQWVADNIAAFGGDPTKVTIWGESAGSVSVLDQMMLYNGNNKYNNKPLFRAAIMNSGTLAPANPVDSSKAQAVYDTVVAAAGCTGTNSLSCLRNLPFDKFLAATGSVPTIFSYNSVALSYFPRPDGTVLTASPETLIAQGKYAAVPMIVTDQEDEGTLFTLFQENITSTANIVDYFSSVFWNGASKASVQTLVNTYPDTQAAGAVQGPYKEYNRLSQIMGDVTFTLMRRSFLTLAQKANPSVPSWSSLATYYKGYLDNNVPLGTFHGSDNYQIFPGLQKPSTTMGVQSQTIYGYYLNFVYNMDPNVGGAVKSLTSWPKWGAANQIIQLGLTSTTVIADSFRASSYQWIAANLNAMYQ